MTSQFVFKLFWNKIMSTDNNTFNRSYKIITASIGFITALFFYFQLNQIARQNETLERSLQQSYRPLGIIRYNIENNVYPDRYKLNPKLVDGDTIFTNWGVPIISKNIDARPYLINKGNGILILYGAIYGYHHKLQSFREELLNEKPYSGPLYGGELKKFASRSGILPGEEYELEMYMKHVPPVYDPIYLYALLLYRDQDGNLYDTEHLEHIPMKYEFDSHKSINNNGTFAGRFDAVIDTSRTDYLKETYHLYSPEDEVRLCNFLKTFDKNLYFTICQ